MSHQLPYVVRHYLAKHLRLPETDVRVIIPHTGGGFGQKGLDLSGGVRLRLARAATATAGEMGRGPHREHGRFDPCPRPDHRA